ncbi:MAG: hypothetical protein ACOY9J_03935 [Pseudomonadota bacterium]
MNNDDGIDPKLRRTATQFLDAETDAIDMRTRVAIGDARDRALTARRPVLLWGGTGIALAAGLAALVVLPRGGILPGEHAVATVTDADRLAATEVALSSPADADIAVDEDLAFIAWLEENNDAS